MLVDLIANETGAAVDLFWSLVAWWKLKNKWKRPITQDDAKAWRMIRRKLKA